MKIFFTINVLLLISSTLCFCSWAEIYSDETKQTVSFDNVYDILVDNVDGDIEIKAVENLEEISVKVIKWIDATDKDTAKDYAASLEIKQLREKDRIIYKTEIPDTSTDGIFSAKVNYQISVPQDIAVVIRNGRGDVKIEGITGMQDIGAANGTVELMGVLGEFQVTVIKGSIKGEIWLNGESEFSNTGGSIELDILDTLSFPITLEATDGDINLRLPSEYSADLEAQCENGSVISEIPLTYEVLDSSPPKIQSKIERRKSESILYGSLNGGGPLLQLNTSNGDIIIQEIGAEIIAGTELEDISSPQTPVVEEPEVVDKFPSHPVKEDSEMPSAEVVRAEMLPSIDGTLNERVWRNATRLNEFYLADGETPADEFTEAYLLWDENNLYLGIRAYNPQMHRTKISQTEFDSPIWEDDDIELLIDTNTRTQQYYHIAVNPIGTIFDQEVLRHYEPKRLGASVEKILRTSGQKTDVTWNSNCIVGTEIYPDFWSVEIAIPLKSMGNIPSPSSQWSFNIHRKIQNKTKYIYWSPTYTSDEDAPWPHFPEKFGTLRFVEERTLSGFEIPPEQVRLEEIKISGNENIRDEEILSLIDINPSERFNPEKISAIRQVLEESGWFSKVTTTISLFADSATLFVEVVENPFVEVVDGSHVRAVRISLVESLKIHGNSLFTNQQLAQYFNLKTGRIVTDQISTKCRLIGELYHNNGYSLASANYYISDGELNIIVDEGRIKHIRIVGNNRIERDEIVKLLEISKGDVYTSATGEEQIFRMAARLKRDNNYFSTLNDWKLDSEQKTLIIDIEEKPIGGIKPHPKVNFNRVHGLIIGGGAEVTTLFTGGGRLYGGASYGISSRSVNFQLGAEKCFFNRHRFTAGVEIYKFTDTNDLGLLSESEDFLSSFLLGDAFTDYFERKGYEALVKQQLTPSTAINVQYADDKYSSLFIESYWSLLRPSMTKRGNPRIEEGKIRSIKASYEFDTRNVKEFATRNFHTYPVTTGEIQNGWQGYFSVEYAGRELKGDFDFTLYKFYITRYNRISSRQTFDFRIKGALSDTFLPPQRLSYIGGVGTLRGYEFKQFMGDNMFLLNVEYRLRFRRSGSSAAVAFVDSGYTFQTEEDIDLNKAHTSIGIGLQLGDEIRIDLAQPLEKNMGPALMLRLERMF